MAAHQSSSSSPGGGCSVSEQAEWSGGGSAHSSAPHETVDASSHASCGAGQAQVTDVSSTCRVHASSHAYCGGWQSLGRARQKLGRARSRQNLSRSSAEARSRRISISVLSCTPLSRRISDGCVPRTGGR